MKQPLAIKYRPKSFEDMTEQTEITQILNAMLAKGLDSRCFLFVGSAGIGKTTAARILANMINDGKGMPIEIDGATNGSVENARNIVAGAKTRSLESNYKVYIIDECHSISNAAWQSLLLVLEQPPQHTCFIFCTTNPEKIPGTILSRVQRFDFRRISLEGIVSRLTHILNAEISEGQPYTYTQEAVEYIAKLAKGGMRSAITSLEKCLNYDANLTLQSVMNALGIVDYTKLFDLADCVLDYNTKGALAIIQQAHDDGKDLKLFMSDFTAFVLDVCKYALTADYSTIKIPNTYSARLLELCKDFKFFKDFLSKLIELNNSIKYERDPKSVIEMNFVVWSSK